jgi:hypothetical protein
MKAATAIVFISVAFAWQGFAVLRPLFPAKTAPPFNGELTVTGNNSIQHSARKVLATSPK